MPDNHLPNLDLGVAANRFIKWSATVGSWRLGKSDDEIVFENLTCQVDIPNVEIGRFCYSEAGLEYLPGLHGTPPRPGEWLPGCRLALHSTDVPDGLGEPLGLATWTTTQKVVLPRLQKLFARYRAAPEAKKNLLPVVKAAGAVEVKTRGKVLYAPALSLVEWAPRRPELENGVAER